jgi:hypothetical protein
MYAIAPMYSKNMNRMIDIFRTTDGVVGIMTKGDGSGIILGIIGEAASLDIFSILVTEPYNIIYKH